MSKAVLFFLIFFAGIFVSRGQVLQGVIKDQAGEPIPFTKVWVKSTSYGTIANGKGEYALELDVPGSYLIRFSATGFEPMEDTIVVKETETYYNPVLISAVQNINAVVVGAVNKRKKGKELMKKVIDKRKSFLDEVGYYSCHTYCFTSLDKRTETVMDSIRDTTVISMEKMNITEWSGTSYFKANNLYKDVVEGFTDYSEKAQNVNSVSIEFDSDELGEGGDPLPMNPYIFVNGLEDADINIFKNSINAPLISQRPLISPLAYNALAYYNFFLEGSFIENGEHIAEVRVEPVFAEEGLFEGTIFINMKTLAPTSYEFAVNKGAMHYFKEMRIICNYEMEDGKPLSSKREFIYLIKEGKDYIHGNIRVSHSDYTFEFDDSKRAFWTETRTYLPEAFEQNTEYWDDQRPFHLEEGAKEFIARQDSISAYHESEEYLRMKDSTYNTLNVWDFLVNGIGFRNTFKKQSFWISGLVQQVIPFGVGGYRHTLHGYYKKEFDNAHQLDLRPKIDYGFRNSDLKGSLGIGYMYFPRKFARVYVQGGDTYDFVNSYESIQGTLAPANRVRNQKIFAEHEIEIVNGLYCRAGVTYSQRRSIENITYPEWVNLFGNFQVSKDFEDYSIFMTELEFAYRFQQKYIIRGNKKYVIGTRWPKFSLLYKKGYPNFLGGQSDFDFLEFRIDDRIDLKGLGQGEAKLIAGSFIRKKDLRIIENKFFRTSDLFFFSNPTQSMQMLDTSLNTANSYLQANFIHHFNGFFLNKVWGLNKLGLEETIGGGVLMVPESEFNQVEFYAGLERMFRIRKQLFKIGVYAVASDNNYDKASIRWKVGVNFYDSFHQKWDY